jgi:hypothetical protein
MMKFSCSTILAALTVTLSMMMSMTSADHMNGCGQLLSCSTFTVTKIDSSTCGTLASCEYSVCLKMDYTLDYCYLDLRYDEPFQHTCEKSDTVCEPSPGIFDSSSIRQPVPDGYEHCQIVSAGGTAEFLMLSHSDTCLEYTDGSPTYEDVPIGNGATASCSAYVPFFELDPGAEDWPFVRFIGVPEGYQTCTDGYPVVDGAPRATEECYWKIKVPSNCGGGGTSGDPHIKLWNATGYVSLMKTHCFIAFLQNQNKTHISSYRSIELSWRV